MATDPALRDHLVTLLSGHGAHLTFDDAVKGLPPDLYGRRPEALPYSPWQLLEHMRFAQRDILDFCRNPDYVAPSWPDDYWPDTVAPPKQAAWADGLVHFRADLRAMIELVRNTDIDLTMPIPHGKGQTFLREALLVADHNAYHLGQMVVLRRLLGAWPSS